MIYIVRHGQTDWNVVGRYQGRKDIELNQKGKEQARKIKEQLKDVDYDLIFSSPLKRAVETANIITDNNINLIKDDRLIERNNGDLEGKLKSEILEEIDFNNPNGSGHGIENINDFRKRIFDFFNYITNKHSEKNILVVTHAGVGIYARCYFEGEPLNNDYSLYKFKNCEVIKYKNDLTRQ